jgi:two-component system nitrogen regulation sensor histidine kinase GlnL
MKSWKQHEFRSVPCRRLAAGRRWPRPPDTAAVLSALPVPVVLLDQENRFRWSTTPPSSSSACPLAQPGAAAADRPGAGGQPVVPADRAGAQTESTVANHDLTLESPRLHKRGITVQGSPLPEEPGAVLLVLQDASAARRSTAN